MSDAPPSARSFEAIEHADLAHLAAIATDEFERVCCPPRETAALYYPGPAILCLCQGAALHYAQTISGEEPRRGIHDFDVWGFFRVLDRPFPWRVIWERDFGLSRFGRSPLDQTARVGRKVDIIGRSIDIGEDEQVSSAVQRWLRTGPGRSPREIRRRPVFVISPGPEFGRKIWPMD